MKSKIIPLLFFSLITTSCAKDLYVSYQPQPGNSGEILLKPTVSTEQTIVTVNDKLLVDRQNVKSVKITDLPEGEHEIYYTSNSTYYKEKIEGKFTVKIPEDSEETRIVQVPGYSNGYWAMLGILLVVLFVPTIIIL